MTVFCPNCGKPNTDTATQCVACGTALKPKAAGSKFKGTMMMTGVTPPKPGAPAGPPAPGAPPPAGPPQAAPPAAAPEAAAPAKQNLAFQATMLGPMTPPPGAPPAPGAAPGGGFGAPPPSSPPAGGFGAPPPSGSAPGGFGAPPPSSGGFGAPPGGGPGTPPPGGGFGAPPPSSGGFGAPPPGGGPGTPPPGGGFGAPPGGGPGTPPPGGGFGAPPPGGGPGGPPGGGFGAPPPGGGGPAAAPKKSNTAKYVGIGCGALLFLSCCCWGSWYGFTMWQAQQALEAYGAAYDPGAVAPAADPSAGGAAPAAGGGGTCGRAAECCSAYLTEMGTPGVVDCSMYQNMPAGAETGCQSAIDGWRAGLQALGRTVPAACQ